MTPPPSLRDRRLELQRQVVDVLATHHEGRITRVKESESIDFKEEAGRRHGGRIEPGTQENSAAATKLADETACMANSPGGGALIVGVEDRSGRIIGTALDIEWLRERIHRAVNVAPDITETMLSGLRILVVYVAESREPVENTGGQIRWRIGDKCRAVDRAQWWEHRDRARLADPMAQSSQKTLEDVRSASLDIARSWSRADALATEEEFLRNLGALRSDGHLTEAAALLFTPLEMSALEYSSFEVPGGGVSNRIVPDQGLSLIEQLDQIERILDTAITSITVDKGLVHERIKRISPSATREALLNGLTHRDWNRSEPTDVRWINLDSTLTVRSPGAFPGEVTAETVLSNRAARYPALADLFRALGLVDKQGVGVDRMYRDMIAVGHQPPTIEEVGGPWVECTLTGGTPVFPVLECIRSITPAERQNDSRVAIILYLLLRNPFITSDSVSLALQSSTDAAFVALAAAQQSTIHGRPIIDRHKGAWILGETAREIVKDAVDTSSVYPVVPYLSTDADALAAAAHQWLAEFGDVTSGDLLTLTNTARGTAKRALDSMVEDGQLERAGAGRSSRYVPAR